MPQKYITNRSFIERETECSSQSCVGVSHFGYRKLLGYSQGYRHYPPWLQGGYRYSWLQELHGVGYKCATGIGLLQDGYSLATGGKKATGILQVVGWLQAVRILLCKNLSSQSATCCSCKHSVLQKCCRPIICNIFEFPATFSSCCRNVPRYRFCGCR